MSVDSFRSQCTVETDGLEKQVQFFIWTKTWMNFVQIKELNSR